MELCPLCAWSTSTLGCTGSQSATVTALYRDRYDLEGVGVL